MKKTPLYFLGPKSENRPFFKEMVDLLTNDYVFWRRNFHPNDPTALSYSDTQNKDNQKYQEKFINELYKLLAELKLDPPFFSPRYMAHMISENTLASQLAYIATLLYNPNNVSSEASPVTIKYEIEVGKQFAKLFGYDPEHSFGHITSGGTLANYQSLFYNLNLRLIPLSILFTAKDHKLNTTLDELNGWELMNIPYEKYQDILDQNKNIITNTHFTNNSLESLGIIGFKDKFEQNFNQPFPKLKILTTTTAHYSWKRSMSLLGLGQNAIEKIPQNQNFEIDSSLFEKALSKSKQNNEVIIQTSLVYGTTEFGSFDPIDQIVSIRNKYKSDLYFPIHIDAAYGGYFATMDQNSNSHLINKTRALKETESITVDPHKLGLCPYGAGAFIFKHGWLKSFLAAQAHYCFDPKTKNSPVDDQLGKYILEGSKPGASAAAVYFNHKMIELSPEGFGSILDNLCYQAKYFNQLIQSLELEDFKLIPITEPQSNIVCYFIKPKHSNFLTHINEFTTKVAAHFGVKKVKSIQEYDYIVSNTQFDISSFSNLPSSLEEIEINTDKVQLIRMVFMNQWHLSKTIDGKNYLEDFLIELSELLNNSTD